MFGYTDCSAVTQRNRSSTWTVKGKIGNYTTVTVYILGFE